MICRPNYFKSSHYTERNVFVSNVYDPRTLLRSFNLYYHLLEHRLWFKLYQCHQLMSVADKAELESVVVDFISGFMEKFASSGVFGIFSLSL